MTKEEVKQDQVQVQEKKKTEAEKLWLSIKDKKIEIFSLPNQTVEMHCSRAKYHPSNELWLVCKSPAVIRSIEDAFPDIDVSTSMDGKMIVLKVKNVVQR